MKEKKTTGNVSVEQSYRFIPLTGWDKVVDAVTLYATGRLPGSRATQDRLEEDVSRSDRMDGLETAFIAVATRKIAEKQLGFHEKMLAEAEEALRERNVWSRSYDYDAMGTVFLKSSIDINIIDRKKGVFALGIYAAYVGDKPEEELAQKLETERAMLWSSVSVQTEPLSGDRFSFDFEAILRKLDKVLDTKKITGKDVVDTMMNVSEWDNPSFVLGQINGFVVTLAPGRVERRFKYEGSKWVDTWKTAGSILSGLLAKSYEHEGQKDLPTFCVTITKPKLERGEKALIWEKSERDAILALTKKIALTLR